MKKFFTLLTLAMISVVSFAATIGAPASIDFGTHNLYGHEDLMDSLELTLNPVGISDYGIGVEVIDDAEGIFWTSDTWLYANGTPDWHGVEKAKVYFYAIDEGTFTATLRLSDYNSAYDEATGIYANHEDVTLSVTIVSKAPVFKTFTRVNSTSGLKSGDEVVFVSESAKAVCGPLEGTYLPAVTEGVTLNVSDGTVIIPETAQTFTLSKYSGEWQFTATDSGKRLHLDVSGKGAFTYADTQAGSILANWGININNGVADVSKPDGTFPVEFNVDRFKPYKNAGSGTAISLYMKPRDPQSIGNVKKNEIQCSKIMREGQLFILRDGKTYTTTGIIVQ